MAFSFKFICSALSSLSLSGFKGVTLLLCMNETTAARRSKGHRHARTHGQDQGEGEGEGEGEARARRTTEQSIIHIRAR